MEIRNHVFCERYIESKTIFVNGKFIKQIKKNTMGSSSYERMHNANVFYTQHDALQDHQEAKIELYDSTLLNNFCSYLSQSIKRLSKNIFFLQINATTFKRSCSIHFSDNEEVVSHQCHGRIFCEIGAKNQNALFKTVFDKGFSLESDSFPSAWWEKINPNLFINKFIDIDQHLYRKHLEKGTYSIVLAPYVSAQLAHEVFGHIFEADNFDFNDPIIHSISGCYNEDFTVVDDPLFNMGWGSMKFDDSGEKQELFEIVQNGRISDKIKNGEKIKRLRRSTYATPLIYRLSNTLILPGKKSPDELLERCCNGIYIENTGQCYCEPISGDIIMPIYEAFKIENGRKKFSLHPFNLYLHIEQVLKSIELVGNDFILNGAICGKMGQKIPVGIGGPSLLLKNIQII